MIDVIFNLFKVGKTSGTLFVSIAIFVVSLLLAQPALAQAAGTSWTVVKSPNGSITPVSNNTLSGVSAISDSNAWAVGSFSGNTGPDQTLAEVLSDNYSCRALPHGRIGSPHGLRNEIARGRRGNRPRKNEANSPW